MKSDSELLRQYTEGRCETAFHELVERYLPLLRGIVWRRSGREDLIDDVAMQVFAAIATKSKQLQRRKSIGGWIVVATRMKVAEHLRNEDTRRRYMKNFSDQEKALAASAGENEPEWNEALPMLDDALTSLSESDREAVILHFYHGFGYREIGERVGRREDATRKRVNKALEHMAVFFKRRGVALPVVILSSGLGGKLTSTAHAGGSLSVTAVATQALKISTPAANLATTTLLTMSALKSSGTIMTAVALVLLSIGAGYLTGHQRGTHQRETIEQALVEQQQGTVKAVARSATETPKKLDTHARLRQLLGNIVTVSEEVGKRPSAWPELNQLRSQVQAHQFESALEIAETEYADDPETMKALMTYLIMDWAKHNAEAATAKVMESAAGDKPDNLLRGTLAEWGSQDANAAQAWLEENSASMSSRDLLETKGYLYGGWARSQPDAAFDAIEKLEYDQQKEVVGKLWLALQDEANRGPFIERLAQVDEEQLRVEIFERAVSENLHQQPDEIAVAYDQLGFEDPGMRRRALDHVTDKLFSNPSKAVQWIWDRAIDDEHRSEILSDWVASGWALQDRSAAELWMTELGYAPAEWLSQDKTAEAQQ